jgi:hypothetical protein
LCFFFLNLKVLWLGVAHDICIFCDPIFSFPLIYSERCTAAFCWQFVPLHSSTGRQLYTCKRFFSSSCIQKDLGNRSCFYIFARWSLFNYKLKYPVLLQEHAAMALQHFLGVSSRTALYSIVVWFLTCGFPGII